ncbi:MAG: EF-P lysine aminoacylase GenX [Chlamydiales bacterium]|nr:EF-P lysine aminoacylase GenX [Chlamydiales bacterium]
MLARSRSFFAQRDVLEVDCPALSLSACVDTHIDVMQVQVKEGVVGYLHTSPEYGMKQLLSQGIGDIYQLSHVFRKEEVGPLHQPEFTMTEWYRCGYTFEAMIEETLDYIRLFLGDQQALYFDYRKLILTHAGIDYVDATVEQLIECAKQHKLALSFDTQEWDRDTLLQCLMSFVIEPKLPKDKLSVVRNYPASQAALARTEILDRAEVAKRFEVYFDGIELANGYHELTDPLEQRRRFEASNRERQKMGKAPLPVDERLLEALERGLPDCCGVAVGFDRLLLLKHHSRALTDILPLSIDNI